MNIRSLNVLLLLAGLTAAAGTPLIKVCEISGEVFIEAMRGDRYSQRADTVSDTCTVSRLKALAFVEFMKLDEEVRRDEYDYAPEYAPFDISTVLHYPALHMYCALIPCLHGIQSWCFDDVTYKYLGAIPAPILANRHGIMAAQIWQDCDTPLDLSFYCREGDTINLKTSFMCPYYGVPFEMATTADGTFYIGPSDVFSSYQCLSIENVMLPVVHHIRRVGTPHM